MPGALHTFWRNYKTLLPFMILMATSFILPTASHRAVLYLLIPFLGYFIYTQRLQWPMIFSTISFGFLVVYLIYFSASLFWSEPPALDNAHRVARDMITIGVFTTSLAVLLHNPPAINKEKWVFWFAGWVTVFAGAMCLYYLWQGQNFETARLAGTGRYENPIHFAYLLSFAVLLLFSFDGMDTRTKQIVRALLVVACLIFIFLSGTRAVLVGLVGCVVLLGLLGRRQLALALIGLGVVAVLASFAIWDFSAGNYLQRADSNRFGIWSEVVEAVKTAPVIGHGIMTEPVFYAEKENGWKSTHNAFLGHAYTGGVIGFVLYLGLLMNMAWQGMRAHCRLKKASAPARDLFFSNAAILLAGNFIFISLFNFTQFMNGLHIHWLMFWVPFAMCWALEMRNKSLAH